MRTAALIPARYAATRFPAKLMQILGSKTVIRHTYDNTVATGLFDEVHEFEAFRFELGGRYVHNLYLMTRKTGHYGILLPVLASTETPLRVARSELCFNVSRT